jgi:propanol-preferring alcohol dehydrogenase
MKAMILNKITTVAHNSSPLTLVELPKPTPNDQQLLIKVNACAVCHTELDEIEGRTPPPHLPIVPGHQVVGTVKALGRQVSKFNLDDRVGVAWIFSACGHCHHCVTERENLCTNFQATGRDVNGGYAEYMVVAENFAYKIPKNLTDIQAAPLLCAGAIGYRSMRLTGLVNGDRLGLTGFGGCAHLVLKMVKYLYPKTKVYVFARNKLEQAFALEMGAEWAGETQADSPIALRAIIDTTPAWQPIVAALKNLESGGRLVINAIRKEDIDKSELQQLDYAQHLWLEKEIKTVANVTRQDVYDFLALAAAVPIISETQRYSLAQANQALCSLKHEKVRGAKVILFS